MSKLSDFQPLAIFFLLELFYQGGKLKAIKQKAKQLHLAETAKLSVRYFFLLKYHSLVCNIQHGQDKMHPYFQVL